MTHPAAPASYPSLPPSTAMAVQTVMKTLCGNAAPGHATMCEHDHSGDAEGLIRLLSSQLGPGTLRAAAGDDRFSKVAKKHLEELAGEIEDSSRPQPLS